jgi:hypothetical protein
MYCKSNNEYTDPEILTKLMLIFISYAYAPITIINPACIHLFIYLSQTH